MKKLLLVVLSDQEIIISTSPSVNTHLLDLCTHFQRLDSGHVQPWSASSLYLDPRGWQMKMLIKKTWGCWTTAHTAGYSTANGLKQCPKCMIAGVDYNAAMDHTLCFSICLLANLGHSINKSIKLYSANIPGEARLSGVTAKSVFNSEIEETVP